MNIKLREIKLKLLELKKDKDKEKIYKLSNIQIKKLIGMVKWPWSLRMEINMKGKSMKESSMEKVSIFMQIKTIMKVNGRMIANMDSEF